MVSIVGTAADVVVGDNIVLADEVSATTALACAVGEPPILVLVAFVAVAVISGAVVDVAEDDDVGSGVVSPLLAEASSVIVGSTVVVAGAVVEALLVVDVLASSGVGAVSDVEGDAGD